MSASGISTGDLLAQILNYGGSVISKNAPVNVTANTLAVNGNLDSQINNSLGGTIGGSAAINFGALDNISAQGDATFQISNNGNPDGSAPGTIVGNASVTVSAANLSSQAGTLSVPIFNQLGSIRGGAAINLSLSGDITSQNGANFYIWNFGVGPPAGTIGGDAVISVSAANFLASTGTLSAQILNQNAGLIGGNAIMNFDFSGDINTGDAQFLIDNIGGMIGLDARINLTATNISVNGNLDVTIDNNTNGGTIGGAAIIDMNPSGTVTVTNDAAVQILNSGLEGSAAINFNGGNWNTGGTFLALISDGGTITFSNAAIHADVVKAGVFGSSGTLRIGGGIISANTLLHLYAPNGGIIDFVSDVTLNSSATAAVIAANTVTIENGVVVTIGASTSANVYTNVPNYSARSGGNNKTSGTFVGAVTTQPLGGQPPFDSRSTRVATRSTRTSAAAIHVTDSSQLSALLDNAAPGPNGKVRVSPVTRSRNPSAQGSTRTMAAATELHRFADARKRSAVLAPRPQ